MFHRLGDGICRLCDLFVYLCRHSIQRQPPQLCLEKLFSRKSVICFQVGNKFGILNSFGLDTGGRRSELVAGSSFQSFAVRMKNERWWWTELDLRIVRDLWSFCCKGYLKFRFSRFHPYISNRCYSSISWMPWDASYWDSETSTYSMLDSPLVWCLKRLFSYFSLLLKW